MYPLYNPLIHDFILDYLIWSFHYILERGNSVEDDRSPGLTASRPSPPAIHLSPSRQSSSSTDGGVGSVGVLGPQNSTGLTVAKKKRELFSARSSRSGGSNKSSEASFDFHSSSSKVKFLIFQIWDKGYLF